MSTAVVADAADLFAAARHCLDARDPDDKIALTGAYARRFRDGALARSMEGPGLIAAYYDRAPRIVDRINARVDGKRVWLQTYFTSILPSAAAAALGLNALALAIYCRMTERLERLAA